MKIRRIRVNFMGAALISMLLLLSTAAYPQESIGGASVSSLEGSGQTTISISGNGNTGSFTLNIEVTSCQANALAGYASGLIWYVYRYGTGDLTEESYDYINGYGERFDAQWDAC